MTGIYQKPILAHLPYWYFFTADQLELEFYKLAERYNTRQGNLYQAGRHLVGISNYFEAKTGIRMRKPRIIRGAQ